MAPSRPDTPLYTQHSRLWEKNQYVYPVISRRSHGLSVGVNLNPDRVCNFDCVYCCVDRSGGPLKPQAIEMEVLGGELREMVGMVTSGKIWEIEPFSRTPEGLRRFADIAFSGDGEPTACGQFGEACRLAAKIRDGAGAKAAETKLVVITNATLLDRERTVEAMRFLDGQRGEIWAKLDAGNEKVYGEMVRSAVPFRKVLENIRRAGTERELVIQSMFLRMNGRDPERTDLEDYLQILSELRRGGCRIRLVQVYTIARPVFEAHIEPAGRRLLDEIAARVGELGLAAEAYYGVTRDASES